jgi:hypothetical protein
MKDIGGATGVLPKHLLESMHKLERMFMKLKVMGEVHPSTFPMQPKPSGGSVRRFWKKFRCHFLNGLDCSVLINEVYLAIVQAMQSRH